ncbi:MAG: chemotaxis protein CheB, partial [Deltaproteobacteria bacterium]|nr:chemotaxis protein CheB [Deltaproteobacteria bacterium]
MKNAAIRNPQSAIRNLIVIASSAGGITPLIEVVSKLPKGLEASVIVVQHLSAKKETGLPELLNRYAHLQVSLAGDGMIIESGQVYIAEPGKHLLLEGEVLTATLSKKVHYVRPSADLLFVSAAASFEGRVIGVVLSGTGKDGALGCVAIKARGGVTMVQDKATARYYGMPQSAIDTNAIDYVLSPDDIVQKIVTLVKKT